MFLTQGVLIATGRCICGDVPYTVSPYSDRPLYLCGCSLHRESLYREAAVFVGMFLTQGVLIATGRCICGDVPYTGTPYSDRRYICGDVPYTGSPYSERPLYLCGCSLHRSPYSERPLYLWKCSLHRESL